MIDEKDIVFGIVNRNHTAELIIDFNNPRTPGQLFGALSYLAAMDEDFFNDIKGVVENVEKNGVKIRRMAERQRAAGILTTVQPNKTKS